MNNREPEIRTQAEILEREGFAATTPVTRPSYWGVDLDMARRPGVPMERAPQPFPNTQFPIERQPGQSAVPMHGRPNKTMPPVFGTSTPMHGLSGMIRRAAYSLPDHKPTHWLMKMFADRVDSMGYRAKKLLPVVLPLAAVAWWMKGVRARRLQAPETREDFRLDRRIEIETVPSGAEVTYSY